MHYIVVYPHTGGDEITSYRSDSIPREGDQIQLGSAQYSVEEVIWLIPQPHLDQTEEVRLVVRANHLEDAPAHTPAWQPIETIPQDGTRVLVWADPMIEPDIAWEGASGMTMRTYTHWMALPHPPNI